MKIFKEQDCDTILIISSVYDVKIIYMNNLSINGKEFYMNNSI